MKKILLKKHKVAIEELKSFIMNYDFYLAGGTAIYYYLSHRISEDLDFFTAKKVDFEKYFLPPKGSKIIYKSADTVHIISKNIKMSFFYYPYPQLNSLSQSEDILLASLEDILAMKISAIIQRGSKKDFTDAYFIIRHLGLNNREVIKLFRKKFGNYNSLVINKALTYFEDADTEPSLKMIKSVKWEKIKEFFVDEFTKI